VLIVEQLAVACAVPRRARVVQLLQERPQQAYVFEALQGQGWHPSSWRSQQGIGLGSPSHLFGHRWAGYRTVGSCTNFVPNTIGGKVRKGGSGRLQHCRTPPHPVPLPQGERGPSSAG